MNNEPESYIHLTGWRAEVLMGFAVIGFVVSSLSLGMMFAHALFLVLR